MALAVDCDPGQSSPFKADWDSVGQCEMHWDNPYPWIFMALASLGRLGQRGILGQSSILDNLQSRLGQIFHHKRPSHQKSQCRELISANDPSAGSPTETLLRLLLPLSDKVHETFQHNVQKLSTASVRIIHRITQSVGATGGVYKGQGRNQHELMTRAY